MGNIIVPGPGFNAKEPLKPQTQQVQLVICPLCGTAVIEPTLHQKFHLGLSQIVTLIFQTINLPIPGQGGPEQQSPPPSSVPVEPHATGKDQQVSDLPSKQEGTSKKEGT